MHSLVPCVLRRRALSITLIFLLLAFPTLAQPSHTWDEWSTLHQGDYQVGYGHTLCRIAPEADGWRLTLDELLVVRLDGRLDATRIRTEAVCDATWRPSRLAYEIDSAGRRATVAVELDGNRLTARRLGQGTPVERTLEVPPEQRLVADARMAVFAAAPPAGATLDLVTFDPIMLTFVPQTVRVLAARPVEGGLHRTLEIASGPETTVLELAPDGSVPTQRVNLGQAVLRIDAATAEAAQAMTGKVANLDLNALSEVRPDRPIVQPRDQRRLVLSVHGLDEAAVVHDARQLVGEAKDGWQTVTITAGLFSATEAERADVARYLAPTAFITCADPAVMEAAQGALRAAGQPEGAAAVQALARFVRQRVAWRDVLLWRTATEILSDPTGVCRDAAVLYTALARAAGLPTRVVVGLVYTNGAFLAHAWAETLLGDQWLPVDPALADGPVDATRLKLAQGADYLDVMDRGQNALGGLSIRVLEAERGLAAMSAERSDR